MSKFRLIISIILLLCFFASKSQTISELEQRKIKTEQEIQLTNKLLTDTEKKRSQSVNELNLLNSKIKLRKKLIDDIELQIILIEKEIYNKNVIINGLNKDISNLKREYAKLIRFAWRNRSKMQMLVFIFSSNDFSQAYKRMRFYQQLLVFREKQGKEIINMQTLMNDEIYKLSENKKNLEKLINDKTTEVSSLNSEQIKYKRNVSELQKREKQLKKELKERKRAMEDLNKAIENLIAEEARKAKNNKGTVVRDSRYLKLSEGFFGNKGKLPWPSAQGIIVGEFGEHNHPVLKGVKIKNNGVDISMPNNSKITVIYEGEVKKVVSIPGSNIAVIVRHGDFLSVYSNLSKVYVKVGDMLKAQQEIGEIFSEPKTGKSILNLQIWHESKIENPENWLLP
ncbi:MAG TPA: peptidoglycan DD-metalloendopeptidase family protein [Tenuifilaceae bacterium]|nr:peptidoglycan DD-metalloendopeptidase family protein [Tenuifilaceae bacterium]HPJ44849.1 peptidoglycan DD-metalloendopeptidase family protein [Tenuifilaceae bacterium]HPQ32857.1 peptidoglycan DD-metalloendopeptidase family protein [Tenuifilaceae bacterium]HRX67214.1 peptidoglycan DD-metalloendopeptidase family protein [Tenuifilaceae bacterium]